MARIVAGCVSNLIILIVLRVDHTFTLEQRAPDIDVNFELINPKGIRIWIPDMGTSEITQFKFNGNINRTISIVSIGKIRADVTKPTDGRWIFEDNDVEVKAGDVIFYNFVAAVDGIEYVYDDLNKTLNGSNFDPSCSQSATVIRGSTATICSGETIFEENFDILNQSVWQIEQYIPVDDPEYPFVSYQRFPSKRTVTLINGNLRIAPNLQQHQDGFTNKSLFTTNLNLIDRCTAPVCSKEPSGADILPPVVSGRITSKGFVFKYGTVHVRAKLPQGDWLYPEILLEPVLKKYGNSNFASGVLKIATARGNKELNSGLLDYGNKVLYGGPIMDFDCRKELLKTHQLKNSRQWGDDFHEYSLRWSPDGIVWSVDGVEWARIEPGTRGLVNSLPRSCQHLQRSQLEAGTLMAPFDDLFHITLGVSAGGISEFDDNLTSKGGWPKPWKNGARKAMLNFWKDLDSWYPTWNQSGMLVDYVKVIAL
ncbi:beta-1,3-glucan-binding protein-like [Achroia grisella]|uniref:beta-1,3-glucan-binding protein-like n=1 Tax=Achroia grisella TaxID=688607 RepID=UPI0027D2CB8D|nr:beta-1,3-glucan-binding protein-like [Achroia grisella]